MKAHEGTQEGRKLSKFSNVIFDHPSFCYDREYLKLYNVQMLNAQKCSIGCTGDIIVMLM